MNGAAKTWARALVRANPRRISAFQPRAVARRRLLSAAVAPTGVTTRDFVVALFLSERDSRPLSYARVPRVLRGESTCSPGLDLPRGLVRRSGDLGCEVPIAVRTVCFSLFRCSLSSPSQLPRGLLFSPSLSLPRIGRAGAGFRLCVAARACPRASTALRCTSLCAHPAVAHPYSRTLTSPRNCTAQLSFTPLANLIGRNSRRARGKTPEQELSSSASGERMKALSCSLSLPLLLSLSFFYEHLPALPFAQG